VANRASGILNLQVDQAALLELIEASEWYEDARASLGSEFLAVVQQAFEQIATAPRTHPLLEYCNSAWEFLVRLWRDEVRASS